MSKLVERVKANMGFRIIPATFCLLFQVAHVAMQMDVHKTLYCFYSPVMESRDPFLRVSVSV